ncbi:uncharacterized protein LOC114828484 [Galendromus occidentalis]|uniref:Uncharacterized protein LOC114828484 n=1 Tax=Galendromus occidentalis TaxID=34638 RepID=A0AAJ7WIX4_9ACAR|nr:uncharacterized protein LOC114828484 [Galendromus occidentalis]
MELFVKELGPTVLTTDGRVLICKVCEKEVKASVFNMDLCQMSVETNIPLYKVQDPSFKNFMLKYCKEILPDHTTLRKHYLKKLYEGTIHRIRSAIGDKRIWVSIDETTDAKGHPYSLDGGTWLSAALYYARHLEDIKRVLEELDESEAAAIKKSKDLLLNTSVKSHLTFIAANFSALPDYIKKLECSSQMLSVTLKIFNEFKQRINEAEGPKGEMVKSKLKRVLQQNPGFEILTQIERALSGEAGGPSIAEMSVAEISCFKYAPAVSVDEERSFSRYKSLLSDRRHGLTPENAKFHMIPMCNVTPVE